MIAVLALLCIFGILLVGSLYLDMRDDAPHDDGVRRKC